MNPRSLFLVTIAVGSALVGAGVALKTQSHLAVSQQSVDPQVDPQSVNQPLTEPASASVSVTPPVTQASEQLFLPPTASPASVVPTSSQDEFEQLKTQLHRAIRERNPVLLRSLMQAGSLREALRGIAATEQVNFDNLDASAWAVLEKAMDYRCRQSMTQSATSDSKTGCFE